MVTGQKAASATEARHRRSPRALAHAITTVALVAAAVVLVPAAHASAATGTLDPSFGGSGIIDDGTVHALTQLADGTIVTAGTNVTWRDPSTGAVRYIADLGSTNYGWGSSPPVFDAVATLPDGRAVAAGHWTSTAGALAVGWFSTPPWSYIPRKYLTAPGGHTFSAVHDVAVDSSGRVLIAGTLDDTTSTVSKGFVLRLDTNGDPDTTFGTTFDTTPSGWAVVDATPGFDSSISAIDVATDGSIVAAGTATRATTSTDRMLAKLTNAGVLDTTFGETQPGTTDHTGTMIADSNNTAMEGWSDVAVLADGGIWAAGQTVMPGDPYNRTQAAVQRFAADGSTASGFNGGNPVYWPNSTNTEENGGPAHLDLRAGGVIAAAQRHFTTSTDTAIAIRAILDDGAPDTTFGDNGAALLDPSAGDDNVYDVAMSAHELLVIGDHHASSAYNSSYQQAFIARVVTDGPPPPTASVTGTTVTEADAPTTATLGLALSATAPTACTVDWVAADGSATTPADYTTTSGTATFAAGATTTTISIGIAGDTDPESTETFTVTLTSSACATVDSSPATVTIFDNDVAAAIVSVDPQDGATGVARTTTVSATFGQTLSTYDLVVTTTTKRPKKVAGSVTCTNGCAQVVFTPARRLSRSTAYQATVTGSTGAGDPATQTWTFTTGKQ